MKTLLPFIVFIFLFQFQLLSQSDLINVNPDPNGEPWWAGKLRTLTPEDYKFLNSLTELKIPNNQQGKDLPVSVDNSEQPYFRPIFSQEGGSCGQASGIGYTFTYEIDCMRGVAANTLVTQYPTHYTWNFLNGGVGGGSWYFDGWQIIQSNGCPNVDDWGGHFAYGGQSRWMSGYDEYLNGTHNKVFEIFSINVGNQEGLEVFKNWIYDHLDGSDVGGIACFGAGVSNTFTMTYLPAGTPEAGKMVVTHWDEGVNHAMTFVGYNDEIRYDFNNDGQYTNDIDINGDGVIDMKDWEIGGVKLANSWGTQFGDQGFAYTMYKNLAESLDYGGIWSNTIHVITTKEIYEPIVTIKAYLKHDSREKVKIIAGVSNDLTNDQPENFLTFPCFNYQGGDLYMQGGYSNSDKYIEIGLDITPLLSYVNPGEETKFFLGVVEKDPYNQGDGEIVTWSLIDYSNGGEEIICEQQNVPLINNDSTFLSVTKAIVFDKVEITTDELPSATVNEPYSYQLEADGGLAPYTWSIKIDYIEEDLSGTFPNISGQQLFPTNNDDGYVTHELDFSFPFYGQEYEQITILTDGAIIFEENFKYIRSEESIISNKCLTAYCADLQIYPAENDGIWYEGNENEALIKWQTGKYNEPWVFVEMAVKLYSDGRIEFYYGSDITEGLEWASGISNGDGGSYTIAQLSNAFTIPDNYATTFLAPDFPQGMQISSDGIFYGTPQESNKVWDISFVATDYSNIFSLKTLQFLTLYTDIADLKNDINAKLVGYPNPATENVTISVGLKTDAMVTLAIYSLNGQRISTLIHEIELKKGEFSFNWNCKDVNGTRIPKGIYYCVLSSPSFTKSIKLVLVN
jgi:hypothetical protein